MRISELCPELSVDIVLLGFVRGLSGPSGYPQFDFGEDCVYNGGDTLITCDELAREISFCQKLGVPVLISLGVGGASFSPLTPAKAAAAAQVLWRTFAALDSRNVPRPLPGVYVDGFDLGKQAT